MPISHEKSQVDLSVYSTGGYDPGPLLKRVLWLLTSRCFFETHFPWPSNLKHALLCSFGAEIGESPVIKPQVKIKYPWHLRAGDHCWLGERAWIDNIAPVDIGGNVVVSQGAYIVTGSHDYGEPAFDLCTAAVKIGSGAWIAAKTIVCPGVSVGDHAVLCTGAVATKNLEPFGIYAGNPAEKLRSREIRKVE